MSRVCAPTAAVDFRFAGDGIDEARDRRVPINVQFGGLGWYKLLVMTGFPNATPKVFWSVRSFAAVALGVGAEFLAEGLKFMAGTAWRTVDRLILLYSFNPKGEVWYCVKDMLLIGAIVLVLSYASVRVGKAISKILHHKGETVILIISILITGLILEEIDQKKYQKEWEHKHSMEHPVTKPSTPVLVPAK